tara:strand:+ start:45680 stop:46378 length:699 start_codon:yes stop_codon:yes gene_type:complete
MLGKYSKVSLKRTLIAGLLLIVVSGNSVFAALVEYKANLFGPGMQVHNCIDLDSKGSLFGDYSEEQGTLSNISGALKFVTITEGFIKRGYNNVKNYVVGTFNDNVPAVLRGMNIFVDLSRGADYAETKVTNTRIREWGWALFYDPLEYATADDLFANRDQLRTVANPYKTFGELCPKYAGGNSSGYHGWCSAGVELYGDYGTPAPVPLPAAFYLLSAGIIGLVSFSKKRANQ